MEGLIGQFNDFSYTIPIVNVTVTKDVALAYAKTHSLSSGGPIFAVVLLILFGISMTLIWLYLVLSACCCCCCFDKQKKNNRGATQSSPRISPRTPISPSCSSAPLKRKGGAPLSSVERCDDEDPMRQTLSLEQEHRRYSFSCFYLTSTLFAICLGICVAGVFVYQSKFDGTCPRP